MVLTVLLTVYLFIAVSLTRGAERATPYSSLKIEVADSIGSGFITAEDIDIELADLSTRIATTPRGQLNTLHIENRLRALDKIEDARAVAYADGSLHINVVPMQPVARVFDRTGSYYINAGGKRINADARYHADVPVVSGHIRSAADVASLLPMFDYVKQHPEFDALVTQVIIDASGDIIVVPGVSGHVINIGDTTAIADKFNRLRTFYHTVAPVRGWEYYDSLSVKWGGRLVATRATKRPIPNPDTELDGIPDETPDDGTAMSPNAAPTRNI